MQIAAIQKLTLLDYPGHTACTVFFAGCNFRCHYCHNPELVLPEKIKLHADDFIPPDAFFRFLETRKGLLDGVCISGGEPTIHQELPRFIRRIKNAGFLVKLDTNGSFPKVIEQLLSDRLVDYIAMDIKASSAEKYYEFVGVRVHFGNISRSKNLIIDSDIPYEFRTTLVREFHDDTELKNILAFIKGAKQYYLQPFEGKNGCLNPIWRSYTSYDDGTLQRMKQTALQYVQACEVRI